MIKEFIPYEEALALKELGFDEDCLTHYYNNKGMGWILEMMTCYEDRSQNSCLFDGEIAAPLYQQAFDWFLGEHGLYFKPQAIFIVTENITKYYYTYSNTTSIDKFHLDNRITVEEHIASLKPRYKLTPHEARLECLKEFIELIKNTPK
jgi:hypothetical protein